MGKKHRQGFDQFDKKFCDKWVKINHIKSHNGIEPRLTFNWGKGEGTSKEMEEHNLLKLQRFLYGADRVDGDFKEVAKLYQQLAKSYQWHPDWMRMVAYDAKVRLTPQ